MQNPLHISEERSFFDATVNEIALPGLLPLRSLLEPGHYNRHIADRFNVKARVCTAAEWYCIEGCDAHHPFRFRRRLSRGRRGRG